MAALQSTWEKYVRRLYEKRKKTGRNTGRVFGVEATLQWTLMGL